MAADKIYPVVLSGGSGTRLWPMSRAHYPKQLLPLVGEQTMLQATAGRVADKERFHPPLVVCNDAHRFIIAEQLRLCGIEPLAIVLEPVGRNTAPAIAAAALLLAAHDPEAVMLVLPSDHEVRDPARFLEAAATAASAARMGRLATFGMAPSRPETGYGYIRAGAEVDGIPGAHAVAAFVEKPPRERAEAFLAEGGYYWNSGMFVLPVQLLLQELERLQPDVLAACRAAVSGQHGDLSFVRLGEEAFAASPSTSIDYAVMEKTDRAVVVGCDIGWSDVGSWSALWEISAPDGDGNVATGDVLLHETTGSFVRGERRLVATLGVKDLVVVDTADALLVAARDRVQDVRDLVDRLKAEGRPETEMHAQVYRPWGHYEGIDAGERFQVKRITVKPGERLSLQMHHHRAEHWIVVRGTALVTRGDETVVLHENESTFIPMGTRHRLENPGKIDLQLIEVQSGSYLGEDDIVRFDDAYGRTEQPSAAATPVQGNGRDTAG